MRGPRGLLLLWLLALAAGGPEHRHRPGRRVCAVEAPRGPPESFVQRVHQPFLTTCDGHRACSTYRTLYRTAYRRGPGPAAPRYACCPGWEAAGGLPGACGTAICQPPCQNGGRCVRPGRCHCPAGWRGAACQTDVDEPSAGGGRCASTVGSGRRREGHGPSADRGAPAAGVDSGVEEEMRRLRSRVDVLEQQLQLVLGPLHGLAAPGRLLAHSLQQLDRIDSLSEQISFLEEQLGSCSCKKDL